MAAPMIWRVRSFSRSLMRRPDANTMTMRNQVKRLENRRSTLVDAKNCALPSLRSLRFLSYGALSSGKSGRRAVAERPVVLGHLRHGIAAEFLHRRVRQDNRDHRLADDCGGRNGADVAALDGGRA